jgi:predicted RNA-binding Zn-ribbon protein involved in translation (DUF1610 family)
VGVVYKKDEKAISWTCPKCGKVIRSLYPSQLDFNRKVHEDTCPTRRSKRKTEGLLKEKEETKA